MIINEGLPDTLINKPDRWLYKVELLLSIVFLTVHSTTLLIYMYITYRISLGQFSVYYCVACNLGYYFVLIHIFGLRYMYFNWYIISFDTHVGKFLYREPGIPDRVFNPTTRTCPDWGCIIKSYSLVVTLPFYVCDTLYII